MNLSKKITNDLETFAKYQQQQRDAETKRAHIQLLIHRSIYEMHDVHTCNCEGCKYYWTALTTTHNGQLYEIFKNIKNLVAKKGIASHHALFQLHLQKVLALRDTKKPIQPLWTVYPDNKKPVYNQL